MPLPVAQAGMYVVGLLAMFVVVGIPTILCVAAAMGVFGADRGRGERWSGRFFSGTVVGMLLVSLAILALVALLMA